MLNADKKHNQDNYLEQKLITVIYIHRHKSRTYLLGLTQTLLFKIPNDCHVLRSHHCYFCTGSFQRTRKKAVSRSFVERRAQTVHIFVFKINTIKMLIETLRQTLKPSFIGQVFSQNLIPLFVTELDKHKHKHAHRAHAVGGGGEFSNLFFYS